MAKNTLLLFVCFLIVICKVSAQEGVYMFVNGAAFTGEITTGVHAGETKLGAITSGSVTPITSSPNNPPTVGRPVVDDFQVTKVYNKPSLRMLRAHLTGEHIASIEFRFYNSTDQRVFTIRLEDVFITSISSAGAPCPNGCPTIDETYSFNMQKIIWTDPIRNTSVTYDILRNQVTSTGL